MNLVQGFNYNVDNLCTIVGNIHLYEAGENLYTKDNLLTVFLILKWVVSNQKLFQQNSFKKCFLVSVQYQMC